MTLHILIVDSFIDSMISDFRRYFLLDLRFNISTVFFFHIVHNVIVLNIQSHANFKCSDISHIYSDFSRNLALPYVLSWFVSLAEDPQRFILNVRGK